jgi:hypothetical protein
MLILFMTPLIQVEISLQGGGGHTKMGMLELADRFVLGTNGYLPLQVQVLLPIEYSFFLLQKNMNNELHKYVSVVLLW